MYPATLGFSNVVPFSATPSLAPTPLGVPTPLPTLVPPTVPPTTITQLFPLGSAIILNGAKAASYFGFTIVMSNTTMVVAAVGEVVSASGYSGLLYVYSLPQGGMPLIGTQTLSPGRSNSASYFARGLAISPNSQVIVAGDAGNNVAYVYTLMPSSGSYSMTQILIASLWNAVLKQGFGKSNTVALLNNVVIIGHYNEMSSSKAAAGAVYIWKRNGNGTAAGNVWIGAYKLAAPVITANQQFGVNVQVAPLISMAFIGTTVDSCEYFWKSNYVMLCACGLVCVCVCMSKSYVDSYPSLSFFFHAYQIMVFRAAFTPTPSAHPTASRFSSD